MLKKRARNAPLRDEDQITYEYLKCVFLQCLKKRLNIPSDEALQKLSSILEDWRQIYVGSSIFDPLKKESDIHATALLKVLTKLADAYQEGAHLRPEISAKISTIEKVSASISSLYTEGIALEDAETRKWIWLSDALIGDFTEAIHSTNPGCKLGISNGGPLGRFIAAITPRLTGEFTTAASVSTQLKIMRQRKGRDR